MSKKLFNLDSCDALNPSLSCFGVPRTDLAPGEEDAWAVYTSGQTSSVSIIKTANCRDRGVLVSDVVSILADFLSIWCMLLAFFPPFSHAYASTLQITVQFPVTCTAAFVVENTDNKPVGVAVCLSGGEVQLMLLDKVLKVIGERYTEKSSRKRYLSPRPSHRRLRSIECLWSHHRSSIAVHVDFTVL